MSTDERTASVGMVYGDYLRLPSPQMRVLNLLWLSSNCEELGLAASLLAPRRAQRLRLRW